MEHLSLLTQGPSPESGDAGAGDGTDEDDGATTGQGASAPTRADWEASAAAVLRKAGRLGDDEPDELVWDRLTRTTLDGVEVSPLGSPALVEGLPEVGDPGASPFVRGRLAARNEGWDVRPLFADPDAELSAEAVLTDLENGATSLWLQVGGTGIPTEDLAAVLEKVFLDLAPVVVDGGVDPIAAAQAFAAVVRDRAPESLAEGTNLGVDPIGARARLGETPDEDAVRSTVADAAELAAEIGALALVVDGTAVHDLGASDVQELGWSLAVGAAYLRLLTGSGRDVTEAAATMEFRYAVTDEQLPGIAKLRAARRLWDRVLELSGVAPEGRGQRQHAVTSRPMMSAYDPWVNMLRTTVAAFSAGVGGADSVTVLPFDAPLGLPDAFSRRIARNTSSLLVSESHVAKVTDPAGGAFAVERLTDDLARAAWAELGRIEEAGGVLAALADGSIRARIDEVVAERDRQVARRTRPLTGLTEFPNLAERLPERRPYADGALVVRPYGHAFEELRAHPPEHGVFLATMGTVAAHTARASFAANLFAAGGITTANPGRNDDVEAVLTAYRGEDGGQPVVCLVGADAAYAEWGADLVAALREAGAGWVVLAGKPGERTVAADLVDDSAAMGVDALDFVTRTREKLS